LKKNTREDIMREVPLTLPEIGMINSTRFILGVGAGLFLAGKMDHKARKAVGVALLTVGTLFSIPVGLAFLGKLRSSHSPAQLPEQRAA
jgi:hypothetical protein